MSSNWTGNAPITGANFNYPTQGTEALRLVEIVPLQDLYTPASHQN